jgi:SpoVK/Ycf46/Vps4 family AAA+-type ATPase
MEKLSFGAYAQSHDGPVERRSDSVRRDGLWQRSRFGLPAPSPTLHMCFTGNPGTGKTTVALLMADLSHRLGHLRRGHLVTVTRDDLVGEYVGHTAPKSTAVVQRAIGGVLFIDEAADLLASRVFGNGTMDT